MIMYKDDFEIPPGDDMVLLKPLAHRPIAASPAAKHAKAVATLKTASKDNDIHSGNDVDSNGHDDEEVLKPQKKRENEKKKTRGGRNHQRRREQRSEEDEENSMRQRRKKGWMNN
jgi:hypothetical protein